MAIPQHCPSPRELDDLELLLSGAYDARTGSGLTSPAPRLTLPPDVAERAAAEGAVELVDPEGLPLARVAVDAQGAPAGPPEQLNRPAYGPFRALHLTPAETRERYAGATFVPVEAALTDTQIAALRDLGAHRLVLVALTGAGTPVGLSPTGLVRATVAAAREVPGAVVVVVPVPRHPDGDDTALRAQVLAHYAGPDPVADLPAGGEPSGAVADIVRAEQKAAGEGGLVLFFTGLSGSGKSTLARAFVDAVLERSARTVSSLDGDVVRRNLSAGLTFSQEDRETNIRRIGWVAAEIARHGGIAVCSPIAPFDRTRRQVRAMAEDAGARFVLVHVATPLEECERRDRKGLYAKARRGEIADFTGISSPYEEPEDAEIRVDTTGRTIEDTLDEVLGALADAGALRLSRPVPAPDAGASPPADAAPTEGEAAGSVDTAARPVRLLFVCTANICRSAFMDVYARATAGEGLEVASAGTHGHEGEPMDPDMAATAVARGLDPSAFRGTALTRAMVDAADLVLTAESSHRAFILDDMPAAFRKVLTLGQAVRAVEAARARDAALTGHDLLQLLTHQRVPTGKGGDVSDPYRRGPEVAERCAAQLQDLLDRLLPHVAATRSAG